MQLTAIATDPEALEAFYREHVEAVQRFVARRVSDPHLAADLTADGDLFMLRVRGESMIDLGIFDGDFVIAKAQETADKGDIVVAGIPGGEATVKTFNRKGNKLVLVPANEQLSPMEFDPDEVTIYGKVVTVMRKL